MFTLIIIGIIVYGIYHIYRSYQGRTELLQYQINKLREEVANMRYELAIHFPDSITK